MLASLWNRSLGLLIAIALILTTSLADAPTHALTFSCFCLQPGAYAVCAPPQTTCSCGSCTGGHCDPEIRRIAYDDWNTGTVSTGYLLTSIELPCVEQRLCVPSNRNLPCSETNPCVQDVLGAWTPIQWFDFVIEGDPCGNPCP